MNTELTTLKDAATLLGTTKGAINQHRRRRPEVWTSEHITSLDDSPTLYLTRAGVDLLAGLLQTPEAEAYRTERTTSTGTALALTEDTTLLLDPYPLGGENEHERGGTPGEHLPDPEALGNVIGQARYDLDIARYSDKVNQHAATRYEELLEQSTITLGKHLGGVWGLDERTMSHLITSTKALS